MGVVNFNSWPSIFFEIQVQIDLIVEYYITIVESNLVLRQPDKIIFS